jgi:hypothetical protein
MSTCMGSSSGEHYFTDSEGFGMQCLHCGAQSPYILQKGNKMVVEVETEIKSVKLSLSLQEVVYLRQIIHMAEQTEVRAARFIDEAVYLSPHFTWAFELNKKLGQINSVKEI